MNDGPETQAVPAPTTFWRRLARRWFVQYNRLAFFSAVLVLGGVVLIAHEVARERIAYGHFMVVGIAEAYGWSVIGAAALLTRAGLLVLGARARLVVAPVVATALHALVQRQIIAAPATLLGWGALSVGAGFALLAVVVLMSLWLQRVEGKDGEPPRGAQRARARSSQRSSSGRPRRWRLRRSRAR